MRADVMQQGASQAQEARVEVDMARVRADMARAQAEQARAAREMAAAQSRGDVRVVRGPDGRTVVHLPGGQTVTLDRDGTPTVDAPIGFPREGMSGFPAMPIEDRGPPQNAIIMTAIVLFFLSFMVVGWPIARAFGRRMDRRALGPGPTDLDGRLQRIEQAVEAVAVEVERVSEAQRFSARLLAERAEPQPSYGAGPTRRP
jgi:hypothetical protein